jgi:hypothetical protein
MNKFLLVRFAPGSGGKFLSCCLQLSTEAVCWDPTLEKNKTSNPELVLNWFKSHFTQDWKNYLKIEPEVPYKLDFISNRFDRGNDIAFDKLIDKVQQNNDQLFLDHYRSDKKIVLILNKSLVPLAYTDQCDIINMIIDTPTAKAWFNQAKYRKLYFEKEPELFVIKQDHPDYCSSKRSVLAQQYNNVNEVKMSKHKFINDYIVNDPMIDLFSTMEFITHHPSNIDQPQYTFSVDSFNDFDILHQSLMKLYNELQLPIPNRSMLKDLCKFYVRVNQ